VTGRWFSQSTQVSSINKTNRHDITEILLEVASYTQKSEDKVCFLKYCRNIVVVFFGMPPKYLVFEDFGGIVDHHCLNFPLFIM
jgi:hypothetical protein